MTLPVVLALRDVGPTPLTVAGGLVLLAVGLWLLVLTARAIRRDR